MNTICIVIFGTFFVGLIAFIVLLLCVKEAEKFEREIHSDY